MQKITSRDNKKLKHIRKIRDGKVNSFVFIEGKRLVSEAIKSNLKFSEIFISENFFSNSDEADFFNKLNLPEELIYLVSNKLFNSISDTKSSQGIILIGKTPLTGKSKLEEVIEQKNSNKSLILMLHEINNPSNLGAILRTAEASGVLGIITTRSSAKVFSTKALRGAMGASFRVPVWESVNFDEALSWAKSKHFKTICADVNATKSYLEIDWNTNYLMIFGSEAHGLSKAERSEINDKIYIPMNNGVESLNLAVASGILLFEAKK